MCSTIFPNLLSIHHLVQLQIVGDIPIKQPINSYEIPSNMLASHPSYGFIYPLFFHSILIIFLFSHYSLSLHFSSSKKNFIFHLLYLIIMVIISMIVVSYYIHQRFPKAIPITVDSSSPLHCYISIVQYHCIHDVAHSSILFP